MEKTSSQTHAKSHSGARASASAGDNARQNASSSAGPHAKRARFSSNFHAGDADEVTLLDDDDDDDDDGDDNAGGGIPGSSDCHDGDYGADELMLSYCSVCHFNATLDGDTTVLVCDFCGTHVHRLCYGALEPAGELEWLCDPCQDAVLCATLVAARAGGKDPAALLDAHGAGLAPPPGPGARDDPSAAATAANSGAANRGTSTSKRRLRRVGEGLIVRSAPAPFAPSRALALSEATAAAVAHACAAMDPSVVAAVAERAVAEIAAARGPHAAAARTVGPALWRAAGGADPRRALPTASGALRAAATEAAARAAEAPGPGLVSYAAAPRCPLRERRALARLHREAQIVQYAIAVAGDAADSDADDGDGSGMQSEHISLGASSGAIRHNNSGSAIHLSSDDDGRAARVATLGSGAGGAGVSSRPTLSSSPLDFSGSRAFQELLHADSDDDIGSVSAVLKLGHTNSNSGAAGLNAAAAAAAAQLPGCGRSGSGRRGAAGRGGAAATYALPLLPATVTALERGAAPALDALAEEVDARRQRNQQSRQQLQQQQEQQPPRGQRAAGFLSFPPAVAAATLPACADLSLAAPDPLLRLGSHLSRRALMTALPQPASLVSFPAPADRSTAAQKAPRSAAFQQRMSACCELCGMSTRQTLAAAGSRAPAAAQQVALNTKFPHGIATMALKRLPPHAAEPALDAVIAALLAVRPPELLGDRAALAAAQRASEAADAAAAAAAYAAAATTAGGGGASASASPGASAEEAAVEAARRKERSRAAAALASVVDNWQWAQAVALTELHAAAKRAPLVTTVPVGPNRPRIPGPVDLDAHSDASTNNSGADKYKDNNKDNAAGDGNAVIAQDSDAERGRGKQQLRTVARERVRRRVRAALEAASQRRLSALEVYTPAEADAVRAAALRQHLQSLSLAGGMSRDGAAATDALPAADALLAAPARYVHGACLLFAHPRAYSQWQQALASQLALPEPLLAPLLPPPRFTVPSAPAPVPARGAGGRDADRLRNRNKARDKANGGPAMAPELTLSLSPLNFAFLPPDSALSDGDGEADMREHRCADCRGPGARVHCDASDACRHTQHVTCSKQFLEARFVFADARVLAETPEARSAPAAALAAHEAAVRERECELLKAKREARAAKAVKAGKAAKAAAKDAPSAAAKGKGKDSKSASRVQDDDDVDDSALDADAEADANMAADEWLGGSDDDGDDGGGTGFRAARPLGEAVHVEGERAPRWHLRYVRMTGCPAHVVEGARYKELATAAQAAAEAVFRARSGGPAPSVPVTALHSHWRAPSLAPAAPLASASALAAPAARASHVASAVKESAVTIALTAAAAATQPAELGQGLGPIRQKMKYFINASRQKEHKRGEVHSANNADCASNSNMNSDTILDSGSPDIQTITTGLSGSVIPSSLGNVPVGHAAKPRRASRFNEEPVPVFDDDDDDSTVGGNASAAAGYDISASAEVIDLDSDVSTVCDDDDSNDDDGFKIVGVKIPSQTQQLRDRTQRRQLALQQKLQSRPQPGTDSDSEGDHAKVARPVGAAVVVAIRDA